MRFRAHQSYENMRPKAFNCFSPRIFIDCSAGQSGEMRDFRKSVLECGYTDCDGHHGGPPLHSRAIDWLKRRAPSTGRSAALTDDKTDSRLRRGLCCLRHKAQKTNFSDD
jgi:hypothetical protein